MDGWIDIIHCAAAPRADENEPNVMFMLCGDCTRKIHFRETADQDENEALGMVFISLKAFSCIQMFLGTN